MPWWPLSQNGKGRMSTLASQARPLPAFQCCTLHAEKPEGLVSEVAWHVMITYRNTFKRLIWKASHFRLHVYYCHLMFTSSNALKPYLSPVVIGSALKSADLWPTTLNFHPSTTLHMGDIGHATSDTRPSRFLACNIEKLGVVWLARLAELNSVWGGQQQSNYIDHKNLT